jgi:hypothetical protein
MHDPTPIKWLLILQGLALGLLAGWWYSLPAGVRWAHLLDVMTAEQVLTIPPVNLWAQVEWLYSHRLGQLQGMLGLVLVAGGIGVGEGIVRRKQDLYGGFLLRWWTGGVLALALAPGGIGGYLLMPWPLSSLWVGLGLAGLGGLVGYALTSGRPYVP